MSIDESGSGVCARTRIFAAKLSVSKWVNEPLPAWNQLLTAHDTARLARRHRWWLSTLALLGRFPRRQQYRGRRIGWLRADVEIWLGQRRRANQAPPQECASKCRRGHTQRTCVVRTSKPFQPSQFSDIFPMHKHGGASKRARRAAAPSGKDVK
jgi:predicted DNA-binding transcriptional regulator AlpA